MKVKVWLQIYLVNRYLLRIYRRIIYINPNIGLMNSFLELIILEYEFILNFVETQMSV